jgi:hypothetical protein
MRFATKRSRSGWIVRSLLATMYQVGFDLQAVPSNFWVNRSATGAAGSPNEFLVFLTQVSSKVLDAVWFHPGATVCDFDAGKNIRDRELILQALRCFVYVWCECGNVDEPRDLGVCSSVRVRVPP